MEPNMTLLVVQTVQAIYELTIQTSQKDNQKTKIIQVTFKTLTALGTLVITKFRELGLRYAMMVLIVLSGIICCIKDLDV